MAASFLSSTPDAYAFITFSIMQISSSILVVIVAFLGFKDKSQAFTAHQGIRSQPISHRNIIGATRNLVFSVGNNDERGESTSNNNIEAELERLQQQLSLIEALEARNEAQLDSFVDKDGQWDSLGEEEKVLLESKESIIHEMEILAEQLVQLWMGQKSIDG